MEKENILLDATKIPSHALKHQTIFQRFDSLKNGEYFILHNDHDPVPLYHQFSAIHGADALDWEYMEKGPEVWEVKITRYLKEKKPAEETLTVGELVANDYRTAEIFYKHGIDFCCNGKVSLQAACDSEKVDYDTIVQEINELDKNKEKKQSNFNNWELDFLADYIINNHHNYTRDSLPLLYEFTTKVAKVHGESHPEVIEIAHSFQKLAEELTEHMETEEKQLFPYIKTLVSAKNTNHRLEKPSFESVENPIRKHMEEHDDAGNVIKKINRLSNKYRAPEDACNTYRTLYGKLEELEKDLFQHIHLENNILFKKAITLEKEVIK